MYAQTFPKKVYTSAIHLSKSAFCRKIHLSKSDFRHKIHLSKSVFCRKTRFFKSVSGQDRAKETREWLTNDILDKVVQEL